MSRRGQRGLTIVTLLIVLAAAGGIFWIISFGPVYWDNVEVKRILNEAANFAYQHKDDEGVKQFIMRKLHDNFDEDVNDGRRVVRQLKLDFQSDDLQLERTETPPRIDIWLSYKRQVKLPVVGGERTVTFMAHATQDLSPVKW